jgi:hypothetical protein
MSTETESAVVETPDVTSLSDDERRELAVKAVSQIVAAEDAEAEGAEESEKKPEHKEEPGAKEELDQLALRVKQREAVQAARAKAKEEHDFLTGTAQAELAKVRAAAEEVQRHKDWYAMLRADPIRAIRESGIDPEDFLLQLADATSPEEKAKQAKSKEEQRIERLEQELASRRAREEEQARSYQAQQEAQARHTAVEQFTAIAFTEDKHPHLTALYEDRPQELVRIADNVALQYRRQTGGLEATFEELAEYLEAEAAKTVSKATSRLQARTVSQQSAPKHASPISSKETGTRRAPETIMDDDEARREAAVRAVKNAVRAAEAAGNKD